MPAGNDEEAEELDLVPRSVMRLRAGVRGAAIAGLFLGGGLLLYVAAHPFVGSLEALALSVGISQFVFIQWVAPFVSEFPEKTSAFAWARRITRAPVALLNMVSSNINQWGVLSGLLAVIYCVSHGDTSALPFDQFQRLEILLTILQAFLGWLFLASMSFEAYEAAGLFVLWLVQFAVPSLRHDMVWVYAAWIAVEVGLLVAGKKRIRAFGALARAWRERA
jgi:cation:H+ antiporter